jgi:hypothetical protein
MRGSHGAYEGTFALLFSEHVLPFLFPDDEQLDGIAWNKLMDLSAWSFEGVYDNPVIYCTWLNIVLHDPFMCFWPLRKVRNDFDD